MHVQDFIRRGPNKAKEEPETIVAEISVNWINGALAAPGLGLISQRFEGVLEVNRQRGYKLASFTLSQIMTSGETLNETIIAVFEKTS